MEANELFRLEGAPNFRDLGGLPVADGRVLRRGLLFRSEALNALTDRDLEALRSLGLKLACDLRSSGEREDFPSRWPAEAAPMVMTGAGHEVVGAADIRRLLRESAYRSDAQARQYMQTIYRGFHKAYAETLGRLVEHLVEGQGAVVIHCMAGKDRTGFICALLLLAVGATRQTAADDYMLSDRYFGAERIGSMLRSKQYSVEDANLECINALCVRPEYFDAMLEQVETDYGSVDGYLERVARLTPARRRLLEQNLLE
jgi:protein-tyrosine phosphatase